MRCALLACLVVGLIGCRDSPKEVIAQASEAAAEGRIVDVQAAFSVDTLSRLKVAWGGKSEDPQKWSGLASKLITRDRKPLEVKSEDIQGEYAMVLTMANVNERRYYLKKDDGQWRIELGGGLGYRRAKRRLKAEADEAEKKKKRKEAAKAAAKAAGH